jgi:hypothetical protein
MSRTRLLKGKHHRSSPNCCLSECPSVGMGSAHPEWKPSPSPCLTTTRISIWKRPSLVFLRTTCHTVIPGVRHAVTNTDTDGPGSVNNFRAWTIGEPLLGSGCFGFTDWYCCLGLILYIHHHPRVELVRVTSLPESCGGVRLHLLAC